MLEYVFISFASAFRTPQTSWKTGIYKGFHFLLFFTMLIIIWLCYQSESSWCEVTAHCGSEFNSLKVEKQEPCLHIFKYRCETFYNGKKCVWCVCFSTSKEACTAQAHRVSSWSPRRDRVLHLSLHTISVYFKEPQEVRVVDLGIYMSGLSSHQTFQPDLLRSRRSLSPVFRRQSDTFLAMCDSKYTMLYTHAVWNMSIATEHRD